MRTLAVKFPHLRMASGLCSLLVSATLLASGCQQGAGEPCQVTSDCEDGLVCLSTGICESSGSSNGSDATPPPPSDARPSDADLTIPDADTTDADTTDADTTDADLG